MRAVAVIVLSVVASVLFAFPPDVAVADCRDRISLSPTPDGEEFAATGRATIYSNEVAARQSFTVQVGVDVPDGTLLYVFVNAQRSEENTSKLKSRFGISYAVFCLKK